MAHQRVRHLIAPYGTAEALRRKMRKSKTSAVKGAARLQIRVKHAKGKRRPVGVSFLLMLLALGVLQAQPVRYGTLLNETLTEEEKNKCGRGPQKWLNMLY